MTTPSKDHLPEEVEKAINELDRDAFNAGFSVGAEQPDEIASPLRRKEWGSMASLRSIISTALAAKAGEGA